MTPESRQKKRKSRWSSGIINKPKKKKTLEKVAEDSSSAVKADSSMEQDSAKSSPTKSPMQSDVNLFLDFVYHFSHNLRLCRRLRYCERLER